MMAFLISQITKRRGNSAATYICRLGQSSSNKRRRKKVSKEKKNLDVCEELENGELENIPTLELAS